MYVLGIGTSKLPDGTNHVAYSQSLSEIGGPGPYAWASSGSLPPGLSLASSGVISGTPSLASSITTPQSFTFGVSLTEGSITVNGNVTINITLAPEQLSVSGGALSDASLNVGYSQALTAAGGAPPYTWSVLAGSMPPGMGLNSSGTFSGTPTSIGSFGFTAQVKGYVGRNGSSWLHDQRRPAGNYDHHWLATSQRDRGLCLPNAVIRRDGRHWSVHLCGYRCVVACRIVHV